MSKTITRKYIQRITKRESNTNIRQSSGGGGGGGGASQYWVEENYISKLFFNQLFTVYDEDGNVVEPNDTESVIESIKSMFGFWTDAYLSALGNGEGGGAELTLASLADVDVHGVANGQALVYDAYTQKWVPGQAGLDPTSLWQELGSLGTEQISSTHLTTALSTYNPTNNFKTINGNSIIGTGDINVGGGGGSYLPLSGGMLTGAGSSLFAINRTDGSYTWTKYYNRGTPLGYLGVGTDKEPYFDNENNTYKIWHAGNFTPSNYLPLTGGTMTGTIYFENMQSGKDAGIDCRVGTRQVVFGIGTSGNAGIWELNKGWILGIDTSNNVSISATTISASGKVSGNSCQFGLIEIPSGENVIESSTGYDLYLNYFRSRHVLICCGGGNVGIGNTSPSYKLHVSGVAYASTGFYSGGYVTALSDARHKDVKGDVGLTVGEVANAPAVRFLWKDRRQEGMQVGSIAQYWQKVMPEAIVKNADGELTMSYGVIALLASIATARKVEDHERRIRELEEENKKLKQQLNAA